MVEVNVHIFRTDLDNCGPIFATLSVGHGYDVSFIKKVGVEFSFLVKKRVDRNIQHQLFVIFPESLSRLDMEINVVSLFKSLYLFLKRWQHFSYSRNKNKWLFFCPLLLKSLFLLTSELDKELIRDCNIIVHIVL